MTQFIKTNAGSLINLDNVHKITIAHNVVQKASSKYINYTLDLFVSDTTYTIVDSKENEWLNIKY